MDSYKHNYQYLNSSKLKSDWSALAKEINIICQTNISSVEALDLYIIKLNELDILVKDIEARLYVKSMQNTVDEETQQLKKDFHSSVFKTYEAQRKLADSTIIQSAYFKLLINEKPEYEIIHKKLKNEPLEISNEVFELNEQIASKVSAYDKLLSSMTIDVDGEQKPLVIALITKLKDTDRTNRKKTYQSIKQIEKKYVNQLDEIFDDLFEMRTKKARISGFSNYRDYNWHEKNCVDYTPKDVHNFCDSISEVFMPIQRKINHYRKTKLGVETLMPWDTSVDLFSSSPVEYYTTTQNLKDKMRKVFSKLHPDFTNFFDVLEQHQHLDFDCRPNKSPAVFCDYFPESGLPFVYAFAANDLQSVTLAFHETTHAIHRMYNADKKMLWQKHPQAEAAELFPLTIELISMEYWDIFFENETDLIAAKLLKLESCLHLFRMVALWDQFQTWVYLNPKHTHLQRNEYWLSLLNQFDNGIALLEGAETTWQNRPLIYRYPFYMIEYGIATLGALSIYRDYKKDKTQTINNFIEAMKLGNTASLKDIYKTAGVKFDFSKEKVEDIGQFLKEEWEQLSAKIGNP